MQQCVTPGAVASLLLSEFRPLAALSGCRTFFSATAIPRRDSMACCLAWCVARSVSGVSRNATGVTASERPRAVAARPAQQAQLWHTPHWWRCLGRVSEERWRAEDAPIAYMGTLRLCGKELSGLNVGTNEHSE